MATDHRGTSDKNTFSDVNCTSRDDPEEAQSHAESVSPGDDAVDTRFQAGVQDIEAITITWSKTAMIVAFILIWLAYFVQGLVAGISAALVSYITSSFALHSLTASTGVISSVIGGVTNMTIAKVLDVFGRPQGFLFCALLATFGLVMAAAWLVSSSI